MKVTVLIERTSDGYYSCFVEDDLPGFAPAGYGDSVEKAKKDMLLSVDEMCEILKEQGRPVPTLEYVYKYDLQSF